MEANKMSIEDKMNDRAAERLIANFQRIADLKRSDAGKYKVIGIDKFDGGDWVQGEFDTPKEALEIARKLTEEAMRYASDSSIATVYYAYDPAGRYLGGDTWHNE